MAESRIVVPKGWGEGGGGSYCLQAREVSVWGEERVLEVDSGGGCTTMWKYSVPLNCTLKYSKNVGYV